MNTNENDSDVASDTRRGSDRSVSSEPSHRNHHSRGQEETLPDGDTTAADPIHVLHVDDEPGFADMVAAFLEHRDDRFVVRTETSPEDGLDVLSAHDIDCIVSDHDMPVRNGIEFFRAVREVSADLPFILFTGKDSEGIARNAISAGITDFLRKNGDTEQYTVLANRIRNAIERARAERERERLESALECTNTIVFETDLETGDVSRHGAIERFFGVDTGTISTEMAFIETVVHPGDRTRLRRLFERFRSGVTKHDVVEYRTNPELGRVRRIRCHVRLDTEGLVVGLSRDLTARQI